MIFSRMPPLHFGLSEDEPPPWNVHRLNRPCQSCGANEWRMPNMVERITGMICRKCGQVSDEPKKVLSGPTPRLNHALSNCCCTPECDGWAETQRQGRRHRRALWLVRRNWPGFIIGLL